MPKKIASKPPKPLESTPTSGIHTHLWRISYGPDGTALKVCDCGETEEG